MISQQSLANALLILLFQQLIQKRSYFLVGHFNDIHAPIHPDRIKSTNIIDNSDSILFIWDGRRIAQTFEPRYEVMYDAAVRYVDAQINRIIQKLKSIGEWDETLLIVTAGHGEALYDRGGYGHGAGHDQFVHGEDRHYMYDELLHVPLLIVSPEIDCIRISSPTSLADFHRIIAKITELPEGSFQHRPEVTFSNADENLIAADALTDDGHTIAVGNDTYKYISPCVTDSSEITRTTGTCYHYQSDIGERHNVSSGYPSELVSVKEK